jgi:hypothetical protein
MRASTAASSAAGFLDVPGDDVDQRLKPCGVGVVSGAESARPGAIEELAGVRPVTGDEPLVERVRPAQAHHYG